MLTTAGLPPVLSLLRQCRSALDPLLHTNSGVTALAHDNGALMAVDIKYVAVQRHRHADRESRCGAWAMKR